MPLAYEDCSIEGRLRASLGVVEAGFDASIVTNTQEHKALTKALQLKRFGVCPRCSQRGISRHNSKTMNRAVYFCRAMRCGWNAIVLDLDLITAEHPDDVLVSMCQIEMAKGGG